MRFIFLALFCTQAYAAFIPRASWPRLKQTTRDAVVQRGQTLIKRATQSGTASCSAALGEDACTASGGSFFDGCFMKLCCCEGTVLPTQSIAEEINPTCCPPERVYTPNGRGTPPRCCAETVVNGQCPVSPALNKRSSSSPESSMSRLPDSHRILLSPDLVAQYYRSNGHFVFDGKDYTDDFALPGPKHASWATKIALRAKQIALPFTPKSTADLKKYVAHRYATIPTMPLSPYYEYLLDDMPEVYKNLVQDSDFTHIDRLGFHMTREDLYQLNKDHPKFNATIHADPFRLAD